MAKLSVIITTYNEERNIQKCLEKVLWADEILVVDSFSTDKTVEIVKKYIKVTLIQHEYISPSKQKNWAIQQVKNDWILILDADEILTDNLINEIKTIVYDSDINKSCDAYKIYRNPYFLGKRIRFSGWQNDYVIRLFKKGKGFYNDVMVHEKLIVYGKLCCLKYRMDHYSYWTIEQYLEKMRRYSTWAAIDKYNKRKKYPFFIMFIHAHFKFFRNFFIKLGFLDGFYGFFLSLSSCYYEFLKYIQLKRLYKGEINEK